MLGNRSYRVVQALSGRFLHCRQQLQRWHDVSVKWLPLTLRRRITHWRMLRHYHPVAESGSVAAEIA